MAAYWSKDAGSTARRRIILEASERDIVTGGSFFLRIEVLKVAGPGIE
jgi:hypothetical protein